MRRVLFSPSWLFRHALALFLIGLFARLGWWQWEKGQSARGTLQNLFYGVEWPIFAAAVVFGWWQMLREELHPTPTPAPETEPSSAPPLGADGVARADAYRLTIGDLTESTIEDEEDEAELASYNRYLATLHERDASSGPRTR
ncbi:MULTISPECIES: hypothetical protein [unclassified Frankia]|uniref:hypothetical protein n=1 Tax=unclassified Frankia TaxID=2632575 RepID=UPI001EF4E2DD|nr:MULTISPECIES: hypothetical protein [unclassified Frankia]